MRHGNSVSYRVAVGLQQGSKVFMIRTMRPLDRPDPGLELQPRLTDSHYTPGSAGAQSLLAWARYTGQMRQRREANPEPQISKNATERRVARTLACYSSEMNNYELCDHLSEQLFSAIGDYFANLSRSVGSISEETYSQQALYLPYTSVEPPYFCKAYVYLALTSYILFTH
jgi:hypothetical protein